MAQATADLSTTKDLEEAARRRPRLATKAIVFFDAHASNGQKPISSYNSQAPVGTAYLSDVTTNMLAIVKTFDLALYV